MCSVNFIQNRLTPLVDFPSLIGPNTGFSITLVALATDQLVCNKTGILLVQVFSSLFNSHRLQS